MVFKLHSKNYKEIEYIVNELIEKKKQEYQASFMKGEYSVEIAFHTQHTVARFTFVDKVEIISWNNGAKILCFSKGHVNEYLYINNTPIFAEISDGIFSFDGKYQRSTIKFAQSNSKEY